MRVLFATWAAYGHVFPVIPFADAVRAQGHTVLFATSAEFGPILTRAGISHVAVGSSLSCTRTFAHGTRLEGDGLTAEQSRWLTGRVFGSDIAREVYAELGPVIRDFSPDVVVYDVYNTGAGLAAHAAGVPALCHGVGRVPAGRLTEVIDYHLRAFAGEVGVAVPDDFMMTLGDLSLDIFPPSLQRPKFLAIGNRVELRPVPYAEPDELPAIARAGRLAYVTLGTVFGVPDILRVVIEGLAPSGLRILVATGPTVSAGDLGPLPDSVTVARWVPQARLLPHVDLAVHAGGSGTVLGALAAGARQLILPQGWDQLTNARVLEQAGAARQLSRDQISAAAVAELAQQVLTDASIAERTQALKAEIERMPAPAELASRLPELIARARLAREELAIAADAVSAPCASP
jgi:UDP:flavonoid glycosyltransferase YjiC (YdhE family)